MHIEQAFPELICSQQGHFQVSFSDEAAEVLFSEALGAKEGAKAEDEEPNVEGGVEENDI